MIIDHVLLIHNLLQIIIALSHFFIHSYLPLNSATNSYYFIHIFLNDGLSYPSYISKLGGGPDCIGEVKFQRLLILHNIKHTLCYLLLCTRK